MDESTGYVTTTFDAESSYPEDLENPYVHVSYRNSAGEIVGGKHGGTAGFIPANGSTPVQVESGGRPAGAGRGPGSDRGLRRPRNLATCLGEEDAAYEAG